MCNPIQKHASAFAKKHGAKNVEVAEFTDKYVLVAGDNMRVVKKASCDGDCGCGGQCKKQGRTYFSEED